MRFKYLHRLTYEKEDKKKTSPNNWNQRFKSHQIPKFLIPGNSENPRQPHSTAACVSTLLYLSDLRITRHMHDVPIVGVSIGQWGAEPERERRAQTWCLLALSTNAVRVMFRLFRGRLCETARSQARQRERERETWCMICGPRMRKALNLQGNGNMLDTSWLIDAYSTSLLSYLPTRSHPHHTHKRASGLAHLLAPHTRQYHPAPRRTVASLCNGTSSQPLSWHGGETGKRWILTLGSWMTQVLTS